MTPALSSNSFFLNFKTPQQRVVVRKPRLTVFAKKAGPFSGFSFGKSANDDSSTGEDSGNSSPFKFDFGKLPDVNSLVPSTSRASSGMSFIRFKDPGTVFVAGASGQAGVRVAQALLREGFKVRAGVSDLGATQELAQFASNYKIISKDESKRLNAVLSNFTDAESIAKSIGNASKVVVTIGPAENGPAAEVTTNDALRVIQAAQLANVGHVAIIYDGSSMAASTYNVLDGITSFFGSFFSRSSPLSIPEFLQKVVETDLSYTLLKTNLAEDYFPESSYNIVVSAEGSGATDYKVSKSKIASLVAGIFSNTAVAENKVVEVYSNPAAKPKTAEEQFSIIPEDGRRKAYAEALAKSKVEEEALKATEQAREAAEASKKREQELKKLEERKAEAATFAKEAQESAAAAASASVESLLSKAKDFSSGLSWEKLSSQLKSAAKESSDESNVEVATVKGQAKARSLPSQRALVRTSLKPKPKPKPKEVPKPKPKQTESKVEVRKVFGGLFQQETIYVDD